MEREAAGWLALIAALWVFWPRVPDRVTLKAAAVILGLIAVAIWGLWNSGR